MYALVLIDTFPRKIGEVEWMTLLEKIENNMLPKAKSSKIFGNVWLIDVSNELSFFRNILDMVQENSLPCKVSFFDQKPDFADT